MKTIRDAHFVPEWIDMSTEVPTPKIDWIKEKYLELAYGEDAEQRLDLYLPENRDKPLALLVLVHGGGFSLCDKQDWHLYPGFYALREGFALASINYRMVPRAHYPSIHEDVIAAVKYLRDNSDKYGISKKDVFLYGTSAGGNLVALAGLQGAGTAAAVSGVASLCPLLDITDSWEYYSKLPQENPIVAMSVQCMCDYIGASPADEPSLAKAASASTYITAQAPAFYLQTGTTDPVIQYSMVQNFADKLSGAVGKENVVFDLMQDTPHAGGGPEFLEEENIMPIIEFFKAHCSAEV